MAKTFIWVPTAFSASAAMENSMNKSDLLTETNTIAEMINHPAFRDFGVHLLPRPEDEQSHLLLRDVERLMPWHSHVQPQVVLQAG